MQSHFDLFTQCKRGDARAQRVLYDLFKARLMGLCRRYTRDRIEAQDVLQDAFIRIFKNMHQLETSDKLESWMKSIAVNTAINHYHKTKKHELILPLDNVAASSNVAMASLDALPDEHLVSLVNGLPDGCRMVFNLFAIEGYTHVEIAEKLDIHEGTSRSQLHHAKLLLKEKLKCHNLAHYYEKFA